MAWVRLYIIASILVSRILIVCSCWLRSCSMSSLNRCSLWSASRVIRDKFLASVQLFSPLSAFRFDCECISSRKLSLTVDCSLLFVHSVGNLFLFLTHHIHVPSEGFFHWHPSSTKGNSGGGVTLLVTTSLMLVETRVASLCFKGFSYLASTYLSVFPCLVTLLFSAVSRWAFHCCFFNWNNWQFRHFISIKSPGRSC